MGLLLPGWSAVPWCSLTIVYDKSGDHYHRGPGLRLLADGREIAASPVLARVVADLAQEGQAARPAEAVAGWRKAEQNPVLGGELGTCFDVSVLREGDTYRMWFSWRPKKSIALVESKDGIALEQAGHRARARTRRPAGRTTSTARSSSRPATATRCGTPGRHGGKSWIGYATSQDGKTWKRMSDKPVLAPEQPWEKVAVMCPHVLYDDKDKLYRMWYSGGEQYEPNAIGYATSKDGLKWTQAREQPDLPARPEELPGRRTG